MIMKRGSINLIVDVAAGVSLFVMVVTGYILRFPLPPASNRTHSLWGMSRHEWGTVHSWAGAVLLVVLLIHIALHWDWIFTMVRRRFTHVKAAPMQQKRVGMLTIIVLVAVGGLFVWVAHSSVQELEVPRHPSVQVQAQEPVSPRSEAPTISERIDFRRDVWPIFETSCVGCHGPSKVRGSFRVDLRESLFPESGSDLWIVPGNAKESRLVEIVSGEVRDMKSFNDHLLTPRELLLIETWINEGADWQVGE